MDKIAGAQGFSNSLELENMLVDLEGWLDARYPIPAENVGANLPHGVRVMTVALCMCSEASLREQNIAGGLGQRAKKFRKLQSQIIEIADKIAKDWPTNDSGLHLFEARQSLDRHCTILEQNFGENFGPNWLARLVAERCATQYVRSTGEQLTFGTDGAKVGNIPSTKFGHLVEDALKYLNIVSNWKKPTEITCKCFDYERLVVVDWS